MSKYVLIAEDHEYEPDDMRGLALFAMYGSYDAAKRAYDTLSGKLASVSDNYSVRILDMSHIRAALADLPHQDLDVDTDEVLIL